MFSFFTLSWVSPSWNMPSSYFNVNAIGTINLLESIRRYNVKSKILVSCTPEEFGDVKKVIYQLMRKHLLLQLIITASKVAQDAVCQSYYASYKMKIVRCRAFNHEGPEEI